MATNPWLTPITELEVLGIIPMGPPEDKVPMTGEPLHDIRNCRPTNSRSDRALRNKLDRAHDLESQLLRKEYERARYMRNARYMETQPYEVDHRVVMDDIFNIKQSLEKKKMSEKQILADALLDNFNTLDVSFNDSGRYTYKYPKDLDIEEGDHVVVPGSLARGTSMRVGKVENVYMSAYNPNEIPLKWIIQKVDTEEFDEYVDRDRKALETLREVEKRRAKRELLEEFSQGLDKKELKKLQSDLGVEVE